MKRLFVLSMIMLVSGSAFAQSSSNEMDLLTAEKSVRSFYDALKEIASDPDSKTVLDALNYVVFLPNYPAEFNDAEYREGIHGETFVGAFRRHMLMHPSSFHYTILKVFPYQQAEWVKSPSPEPFVYAIVDKSYGDKAFRDTVLVNGDYKIVGIRNSAGGQVYSKQSASKAMSKAAFGMEYTKIDSLRQAVISMNILP